MTICLIILLFYISITADNFVISFLSISTLPYGNYYSKRSSTILSQTTNRNDVTVNSKPNKSERFIHPQVYKMFQRAQYLARNGENVVAQRLLIRCLELNPYDSHSWLALARLEAKWGNIERSREIFSQGIVKCPNNIHLLQAWGHMEQKYGNQTLAQIYLSAALTIDPYNAYVCHTLSSLELRNNNVKRAREILTPVFEKKPTSAICTSLAELERQEGNISKAKDILVYGLKKCRLEKSKILLSLAWLEEEAFSNPQEAYKLIDLALKSDPNDVRVHLAKANLELRLNKFSQAKSTLIAATKLVSEDGKHFTMLGTLELESGNIKEAQQVLLEGTKLYPGDFFLLQRLGTLEAKYGSVEKAREIFSRAITIHPHAPTFVAWAILEESQGSLALQPRFTEFVGENSFDHDLMQSSLFSEEIPDYKYDSLISDDFSSTRHSKIRKFKGNDLDKGFQINFMNMTQIQAVEYANNQLLKARELFSLGLIIDNRHGPLYHAYGNMEIRHGNISGAYDIFLQGIQSNSTDTASIYHAWALLELKRHNINEASEILKKGIEVGLRKSHDIDQSVKFLFHSLGMLELDHYRPDEAERVFQSAIKIFPSHSHLILGLALAEMKLGKSELCRKHFKDAIDADVYHAHAWQCWAIFEKQCGNLELASILFKQGLKKNPFHAPLWHAFAVMEIQQGNFDAAKSLFEESIKRCPSHPQTYQSWACLEVRLGNLTRAKELTVQGLMRAPNHPALWTVAGLVEARLGDNSKARETFNAAIIRFPLHGALYKVLGELESRQGMYLEARSWFNLGISKDPHYAPLYHEAALLEAKLGNLEGLSALHNFAKTKFQMYNRTGHDKIHQDIIEKIRLLEVNASFNKSNSSSLASLIENDIFNSTFPEPDVFEAFDQDYFYNDVSS